MALPGKTVNVAGISEPLKFMAMIYLPLSGLLADARVALDESILGPVTSLTHNAAGQWTIVFTEFALSEAGVLITTGIVGPGGDDFSAACSVKILTGQSLQIYTNVGQVPVAFPMADDHAWIKIERTVF